MKKNAVRLCILLMLFCLLIPGVPVPAAYAAMPRVEGIDQFPASYKPYLNALNAKYPNWSFVALKTGLDWNTVINMEYSDNHGRNLVSSPSYSDAWKCQATSCRKSDGTYIPHDGSSWVGASAEAIAYMMDPRNFLTESQIFQFENLTYYDTVHNKSGVEEILKGRDLHQREVSYLNTSGQTVTMPGVMYSDLIMGAAALSSVSPYHLASRIVQETSASLSNRSISGNIPGYVGYYNFFNVGAYAGTDPVINALIYAKATDAATLRPWDNPKKSIEGGALTIGKGYVSQGQNTLYLQKWDVDDTANGLYWHQYMGNIIAPSTEQAKMYSAYAAQGMLETTAFSFVIPVFNNMPETACPSPDSSFWTDDNTQVYANVDADTPLNIRSGPGTSYNVIAKAPMGTVMTRIAIGTAGSYIGWDKVRLADGTVGWASRTYLAVVENGSNPPPPPPPADPSVTLTSGLKASGNMLQGIAPDSTVNDIVGKISTTAVVKIYNKQGVELSGGDKAGTGATVKLFNNGNVFSEYKIVVFGDANGNGQVNSADLLVIQRYILKLQLLSTEESVAARITKDGKAPTSADLLKIQRHILKIQLIEQ